MRLDAEYKISFLIREGIVTIRPPDRSAYLMRFQNEILSDRRFCVCWRRKYSLNKTRYLLRQGGYR